MCALCIFTCYKFLTFYPKKRIFIKYDADTAALNELLIAKKRLGGWFSKGIIVTFSREKQEGTGTYQRCKMLGLEMLDERDILAVDFRERLVRTIREHDLISLKWKKV